MNESAPLPPGRPAPPTSLWHRTSTYRFLRWACRWRTLRGLLLTIVGLITLVALFYAVENFRGKRAWDRHKKTLQARGEILDLIPMAPPPVPDDQNLAMAPLLKPIFSITNVEGRRQWTDSNGWTRVRSISAYQRAPGHPDETRNGSMEKGTFADLESFATFYRGNTNYPQPAVAGNAAQDILVALGKYDAEMKELHQAAAERPEGRFPVQYDDDLPAAILLPHLAVLKGLVNFLQVRATALLELGRAEEALEDLKLGLILSDTLRQEPIIISHLVRIAMLMIDFQVLREGLVRHAWNDKQLAELEQRFASMDLLAEFKHALRGERALSLGTLDHIRRQGPLADYIGRGGNLLDAFFSNDEEDQEGVFLYLVARWMPRGWYYQNMVRLSQWFQDYALPPVDAQAHRVYADAAKLDIRSYSQWRRSLFAFLAGRLYPAIPSSRGARSQTYLDLARIACALERHRLAHGQFPDSLQTLVPSCIDRVPQDVVTGKPLIYKRDAEGGYLLYSVGWNQTDNGGDFQRSGEDDAGDKQSKDDWAWRMPAVLPRPESGG